MIALILACQLNSKELVLGKDIAAIRIDGFEASDFGMAVAAGEDGVLVTAPMADVVYHYGWDGELLMEWTVNLSPDSQLYWVESDAYVWNSNNLFQLFDNGESALLFQEVTSINHCNGDWVSSTEEAVESIVCGLEEPVESRCDDSECTVELNDQVIHLGQNGDFHYTSNGWCWATVSWDDPNDGGLVTCENGGTIKGMSGERLGIELSYSWVSGTMGRQLRPPRGRVRSLDSNLSLVVEGASDSLPFSISETEDWLVIGVPTAQQDVILGAIWLVPSSMLL